MDVQINLCWRFVGFILGFLHPGLFHVLHLAVDAQLGRHRGWSPVRVFGGPW